MRIGVDCRLSGLKNAGIGRYVDRLVEGLLTRDSTNEYVLFVRADEPFTHATACHLRGDLGKCRLVPTNAHHYSIKEQVLLPSVIRASGVELMHYPNFNTPIICQVPYVITIHDLIKHFSRGRETTTRQSSVYWFKYAGYHVGFFLSVKRARKIIVPTETVKKQLQKHYSIEDDKVVVTREGIGDSFIVDHQLEKAFVQSKLSKYQISQPYILCVGSLYPHKNVERLVEATVIMREKYKLPYILVVVCGRSVFWDRFAKYIVQSGASSYVRMVGFVPDEDLKYLYNQATAFVYPTLSEGFGLPGLEAMASGCPVVCSDIPVLRETYGETAKFFDPLLVNDMAEKITQVVTDESLRQKLISAGRRHYPSYSWDKMVDETVAIYREASVGLRSGQ